mgnify:CR=1 FL=1
MKHLLNEFTVFTIMSFKAAFEELKEETLSGSFTLTPAPPAPHAPPKGGARAGSAKNMESVDANKYCINFLKEYGKLYKIIVESLEGDQRFEEVLKKAAAAILNDNAISPKNDVAELTARNVARFSHNLLADPKADLDALVNDPFQLRGALLLFSMVASKDVRVEGCRRRRPLCG